ncbi:MAG TPA: tripartite tricarboxylate transporter substrate binding protein [Eoetvoesiella sp.]
MKFFCSTLVASALLSASSMAYAAYPDKSLHIIVPYAAGSPADIVSRVIGEGLSERLGQAVVVENKAGANGMIGSDYVKRSAPDGYTLMLGNMDTHALNPLLYKNIRYEPAKDFSPVILLGTLTTMLVSSPQFQANTGKELIDQATSQPGKITYGSWGLGSVAHLWGGALEKAAGISLFHVPYQGTPAALNALMGNQIDLLFAPPSLAVGNANAGKLKILGVTSAQRLAQYPDVPTLAEQGFNGYEGTTWFGMFAPKGVPDSILEQLNKEINGLLSSGKMAKTLETLSMTPKGGSRQELSDIMEVSRKKWGQVIVDQNIDLSS